MKTEKWAPEKCLWHLGGEMGNREYPTANYQLPTTNFAEIMEYSITLQEIRGNKTGVSAMAFYVYVVELAPEVQKSGRFRKAQG